MDGQNIFDIGLYNFGGNEGPYIATPKTFTVHLNGRSLLATLELASVQTLDDDAEVYMEFISVTQKTDRGAVVARYPGARIDRTVSSIGYNAVTELVVQYAAYDGRGRGNLNLFFWPSVV